MRIESDDYSFRVVINEIDIVAMAIIAILIVQCFCSYYQGKRDGRTEYILGLKETLIYESIMGGGNARP